MLEGICFQVVYVFVYVSVSESLMYVSITSAHIACAMLEGMCFQVMYVSVHVRMDICIYMYL